MQNIRADSVLGTRDLAADITFFTERFAFQLLEIFPADDPQDALLSGHGCRIRLRRSEDGFGFVRILADDPVLIAGGETDLTSPGGVRVEIAPLAPAVETPLPQHEFVIRRMTDNAPWILGRAGMQYRDLIPGRLGGSIIASHIRIPDEGPVPDMVHYHSVGFQLIYCYKGWVDLVYEDQGPPFRLTAGNCVIQPPEIRHRVLYASKGLEVIEIGVPAEHLTTIDHAMELPTQTYAPDRRWAGQRFVHHKAKTAPWEPARLSGFLARDTGIAANTNAVADVQVLKPGEGTPVWTQHSADILFAFVLAGEMSLEGGSQGSGQLTVGDAFVIPPGMETLYRPSGNTLELLEVALPGDFTTSESRS